MTVLVLPSERHQRMAKNRNIITIVLFVASSALIVVGALMGEPDTVLGKAINVCMECIGSG